VRRALLATALALLAPAAGAETRTDFDVERWVDASVDDYLALTHLDPRHVLRAGLRAEAMRKHALGASDPEMERWLLEKLEEANHGFAPPRAVHDDRVRYWVPLSLEVPRCVGASVGSPPTHLDPPNYHAVDFAVPRGTPVFAARAGVVARVYDGFAEDDPKRRKKLGNAVFVLHEDGTFASYLHLEPGAEVREGQRLRRGERLGRAGNTGFSTGPHLHFSVSRREGAAQLVSIPFRFHDGGPEGFVPQLYGCYGSPPPSTLQLEVTVAGAPAGPGSPVAFRVGDSGPLRVFKLGSGGAREDVSQSPQTRIEVLSPWGLYVDEARVVHRRPTPGYEDLKAEVQPGQLYITHGAGPQQSGHVIVHFKRGDWAKPN
jgi:hypothetical protein